MTIARQATKQQKKVKIRYKNVTGMKVYPPPDKKREKHFNFRKREKGNMNGGLYYEGE